MFTEKFNAIVSAPSGKLKDKKNQSVRTVEFSLKCDFDDKIVSALDKDGKAALKGLQSRTLKEVKIPIDRKAAIIKLRIGKERVTINAIGTEMIGKSVNAEDAKPIVEIKWRFDWDEKAWIYLGRNFGQMSVVEIESRQLELLDGGADSAESSAN